MAHEIRDLRQTRAGRVHPALVATTSNAAANMGVLMKIKAIINGATAWSGKVSC